MFSDFLARVAMPSPDGDAHQQTTCRRWMNIATSNDATREAVAGDAVLNQMLEIRFGEYSV
jgi:hypothetical protein